MDVRFTSSARVQLLEAVVRARDRDRGGAVELVDRVEDRLRAVAGGAEGGAPVDGVASAGHDGEADELRLFYRIRGEALWILAVWSEDDPVAAA
jgi:hypothetical protein